MRKWEFWAMLPLGFGAILLGIGATARYTYHAVDKSAPDSTTWLIRFGVGLVVVGIAGVIVNLALDEVDKRRSRRAADQIPRNRDALIAAIKGFEHAAYDLIADYQNARRNPSLRAAYVAAANALEVEEAKAGPNFRRALETYRMGLEVNVDSISDPGMSYSQKSVDTVWKRVYNHTNSILEELDDGRLYKSTQRSDRHMGDSPSG